MSIESRIRRLERALAVGAEYPRNCLVAKQCEDDPNLFMFDGKRMTMAEVTEAVDPRDAVICITRVQKKPLWQPEQD